MRPEERPFVIDPVLIKTLQTLQPVVRRGRVTQAIGTTLRASGLGARIGQQCRIRDPEHADRPALHAEVVGLSGSDAILVPLSDLQGLAIGAEVEVIEGGTHVPFGEALLGRVINAFGEPLDGRALPQGLASWPLMQGTPNPLERRHVAQVFPTGVRAIDAALTIGEGQRVGIFSMAGGGKSTLLGMLARQASSDVNVIALVGERGREVREFLDDSLGASGLSRSVVVVSTSDRPAMERQRAALVATAVAEGFRAQGRRVLLLMDSVTRYARALREIGLSVGEPAVRRGYPPSVFAELPRLFERAGNDATGSITAFYTVLAEDEDGTDPVAEEVRSILDGHIVLSRSLGQAGHYPAIDVLGSVSRVFNRVTTADHRQDVRQLRALMARHAEIRLLLQVGEYEAGSDALADAAIARFPDIQSFLQQAPDDISAMAHSLEQLHRVVHGGAP
jgi:type III secretion protein N (ATPase)